MSPDTRPPVVVGVCGDDRSALAYAAREARDRSTSLRLVHVAPGYVPVPMLPMAPDSFQAVGERLLQHAHGVVDELAPGLEVTQVLRSGSRTVELARAASDAQLLVVGRRGHGGTAARVCARAACPVAVVPAAWDPVEGDRHRVVVGVRSGTPGGTVLGEAFAYAAEHAATVVAVHVWHIPDPYADLVQARTHDADWTYEGTKVVEDAVAEARTIFPHVPVEVRVVHGRPVQALQDEAESADLLVLQRRPHVLLPHGHLGSTARALVGSSPVPVMVLPPASPDDEPPLVLEESGAMRR